jgi:DNA replication protein DnaC
MTIDADIQKIIDQAKASWDAAPKAACTSCGVDFLERDLERGRCLNCGIEEQRKRALWSRFVKRVSGLGLTDADVRAIWAGKLEQSDALRHVTRWIDSSERALVICGRPGCGKTVAAAWALSKAGGDAVRCSELAQRIDPWGDESGRFRYLSPDDEGLVVLDDLGHEAATARNQQAVERFVDCRVGHGRTVITTNLAKAEIRPRYGDRVADRLNHIAKAVEIADASLRRKGDL